MKLESYVSGKWVAGNGQGRPLVNPTIGDVIATADANGIDVAGGLAFARKGGVALREMTFAERGVLLKEIANILIANRDTYEEIARQNSGNTKLDASIDIDGGIGTLKYYAGLASRLGDAHQIVEAGQDQLAREPVFFSQHFWTTRPGVAVQINAFNFPSWGMWEKIAVATMAGVPSFAKPATATALLSFQMMKDVIEADLVPAGVLNILCGNGEALLENLGPMDSIAFTGSADTGHHIKSYQTGAQSGIRLNIEADSINATVLGPDVVVGSPLFDLAVKEVTKAVSVKAGQLCTNIRRVLVPKNLIEEFSAAVADKVQNLKVGDPSSEETRVGPLINKAQQADALSKIELLSKETNVVISAGVPADVYEGSSFVAPTVLVCKDAKEATAIHEIEVFGPCATIISYEGFDQAIDLGARAKGSLALSLFSNDRDIQSAAYCDLGPWHGRLLMVDEQVGKNHTGHSIVMPQCVHGGPGRAGNGEELGGLRGVRFHMQRSAIQSSPDCLEELKKNAAEVAL